MTGRRDPPFTQAAVTRAVRGCEKAGREVERVEIRHDGTIVVITRRPGEHGPGDVNEWDAGYEDGLALRP